MEWKKYFELDEKGRWMYYIYNLVPFGAQMSYLI